MKKLKSIEEVLNRLIGHPVWDKTFILRASKKKIQNLLSEIEAELVQMDAKPKEEQHRQQLAFEPQTMRRVYVFMFQSRDTSLNGWAKVIKMLNSSASGRPIYNDEKDVLKRLQALNNKVEAGYLSVLVDKDRVLNLPEERTLRDPDGVVLLSLENQAISAERIEYFYTIGKKFSYQNNELLPYSK